MMAALEAPSTFAARRIIETVGSSGTPPQWGFQYFTSGIEPYLNVLEADYLQSYLPEGGATFKLLVGTYGGGKTHFLYSVRALGWKHGFPVAYVTLSPEASPFHRLDRVYAEIARNITLPALGEEAFQSMEAGLMPLLKMWHLRLLSDLEDRDIPESKRISALVQMGERAVQGLESLQMQKALVHALEAIARDKHSELADLLQWLTADGYSRERHKRYGLLHAIDKSVALDAPLANPVGTSARIPGLCILFDEAEQVPSLSTRQRDALLSNLRELIDECGHQHFAGVLMVYAVPDSNFFEGRSSVYEALNQRISSVFEVFNPTGVTIRLDELDVEPLDLLQAVGSKLADVYERAYDILLPNKGPIVAAVAKAAYEQRFGDIGYKRLFVQGCVKAFHLARAGRATPLDLDAARKLL